MYFRFFKRKKRGKKTAGGKNGAKRPRLPLRGSWHGEAATEEAFPAAAGDSPLINAGGKNGAKPPWLSLWESWRAQRD